MRADDYITAIILTKYLIEWNKTRSIEKGNEILEWMCELWKIDDIDEEILDEQYKEIKRHGELEIINKMEKIWRKNETTK